MASRNCCSPGVTGRARPGAGRFDVVPDARASRNSEAHTRRLVAQLEHLGHTVTLDSAA